MPDVDRSSLHLEQLVDDLKTLREKGLTRLHSLEPAALKAAVDRIGGAAVGSDGQTAIAIEALLRRAVEDLGDGTLGQAAALLFGFAPNCRGLNPTDLRQRAADRWGVTRDSFRKQPEHTVMVQIAQKILEYCAASSDGLEKDAPETSAVVASAVRGYHGTHMSYASDILKDGFRASENKLDWLGDGIYFFQDSSQRAIDWAKKLHTVEWAVVKADISLTGCMDLLDKSWFATLEDAHDLLVARHRALGLKFPTQEDGAHGMDRLVINAAVDILAGKGMNIRSVRSIFQEGRPAFPGSALFDRSHIQIAVRDLTVLSNIGLLGETK